MKSFFIISFFIGPIFIYNIDFYNNSELNIRKVSKNDCYCEKISYLKEIINCNYIHFDNKSKLYWSFNCDSSWLTFENSEQKKEILYTFGDGTLELTGRIGFRYVDEYKTTFLIQNDVISGCCQPSEFIQFNKQTGKIEKNLGNILYYSDDKKLPFAISLTNSSYDDNKYQYFDGNSLTIYNLETQKEFYYPLPKGEIDKACTDYSVLYPEKIFCASELIGTKLKLSYDLKIDNIDSSRTIEIDLKNYLK